MVGPQTNLEPKCRATTGIWELCPTGVQEPVVRGSGAKPPEADNILLIQPYIFAFIGNFKLKLGNNSLMF